MGVCRRRYVSYLIGCVDSWNPSIIGMACLIDVNIEGDLVGVGVEMEVGAAQVEARVEARVERDRATSNSGNGIE